MAAVRCSESIEDRWQAAVDMLQGIGSRQAAVADLGGHTADGRDDGRGKRDRRETLPRKNFHYMLPSIIKIRVFEHAYIILLK